MRSTVTRAQLDHRLTAVPGIVEEQARLVADDLQLVAVGEGEAGVEVGEHVRAEPHRAGERHVDSVAADALLAADGDSVRRPTDGPR